MSSITQDMKYRQSLLSFAQRHGVSKASRKYNKARSYIYFWLNRYDGSLESLACRSRRHTAIQTNTPKKKSHYCVICAGVTPVRQSGAMVQTA